MKFYTNSKNKKSTFYFAVSSQGSYAIYDRKGKQRYISMKTNQPVLFVSDMVTTIGKTGVYKKIPTNVNLIDNSKVPYHIKRSLAYYLTVNDNRRFSTKGKAAMNSNKSITI